MANIADGIHRRGHRANPRVRLRTSRLQRLRVLRFHKANPNFSAKLTTMKTSMLLSLLLLSAFTVGGQEVIPSEHHVVNKGPNYRVWEQLTTTVMEDGTVVTNRSSYTEL